MCDEAWKIIIEIISEREAQIKFNINQVRNIRQIKGNMGRILYIAHGNINRNRTTIFRANGSCDECEMKAKEEEKRAGFRVSENLLAAILAGGLSPDAWASGTGRVGQKESEHFQWGENECEFWVPNERMIEGVPRQKWQQNVESSNYGARTQGGAKERGQ